MAGVKGRSGRKPSGVEPTAVVAGRVGLPFHQTWLALIERKSLEGEGKPSRALMEEAVRLLAERYGVEPAPVVTERGRG